MKETMSRFVWRRDDPVRERLTVSVCLTGRGAVLKKAHALFQAVVHLLGDALSRPGPLAADPQSIPGTPGARRKNSAQIAQRDTTPPHSGAIILGAAEGKWRLEARSSTQSNPSSGSNHEPRSREDVRPSRPLDISFGATIVTGLTPLFWEIDKVCVRSVLSNIQDIQTSRRH